MLDDNCIFCKIAAGEIPSETVYEDEQFRAILDLGPASAGHTLILPKAHFKDVTEISDEYAANVLKVAAKLGKANIYAIFFCTQYTHFFDKLQEHKMSLH